MRWNGLSQPGFCSILVSGGPPQADLRRFYVLRVTKDLDDLENAGYFENIKPNEGTETQLLKNYLIPVVQFRGHQTQ